MLKEMEEIINLLTDRSFDCGVVTNYINSFYNYYINNNYYPIELMNTFGDSYFPKNIFKVDQLVNISKANYLTSEHKKVILCQNLIFHNKDNIYDRSRLELILANMFLFKKQNLNELDYAQVINFYKGNHTSEDVNIVLNQLAKFNLALKLKDFKIFGIQNIPYKDEDTIKNNYFNFKYGTYNGENFSTIIGRYGEYLVFNELRKDNDSFNFWVSKDIGDGFGYDIMSVSKNTYQTKIIEVKTTSVYDITPRKLSYNEENILYLLKICNFEKYDYEVKVVSLRDDEEPIIYTFALNKELSRYSNDFIFDVSSDKSSDTYITKSYLANDENGKQRRFLSVTEELKPHKKIYIKK